jgi:putative transcriptional regulator
MPPPGAKPFRSLKGQLLLDGGGLQGSYFHRTVLLICRHNAEGAFGLVLNRPSAKSLGEALAGKIPDALHNEILHQGGPVQPEALSFLHSDQLLLTANVIDKVSVGHDLEELCEMGRSWSPNQRLRVFAGYAGWAPGQLDDELRRKAWLVHPASIDLIFEQPTENLWKRVLRQRGGWEERLLADAPDDLSAN